MSSVLRQRPERCAIRKERAVVALAKRSGLRRSTELGGLGGGSFRDGPKILTSATTPMPTQMTLSAADGQAPFQLQLAMKPNAPTTLSHW